MAKTIVVGGSSGLGRAFAEHRVKLGDEVVITGRDAEKVVSVAAEIGARGLALDLARPETIAASLASLDAVDHLVITATEQFPNRVMDLDLAAAIRVATIKAVGYPEVVHVLRPRFRPNAAVVLYGGVAKERPYPGSTMVTTSNGAVSGLVKTLALELAPHRVNALHPGVVGDSPKWRVVPNHPAIPRTPIGRLVTMDEIIDATDFLLRNSGINAQDLYVDGGYQVT